MRNRITAAELKRLSKGIAPPPAPLESEIQRSIIAYLEALGAVVIRCNSGMFKRADGGMMRTVKCKAGSVSDLLVAYRGRFIALEVKRPPRGKPTEGQSAFLNAVRRAGGVAAVVTSIADTELAIAGA